MKNRSKSCSFSKHCSIRLHSALFCRASQRRNRSNCSIPGQIRHFRPVKTCATGQFWSRSDTRFGLTAKFCSRNNAWGIFKHGIAFFEWVPRGSFVQFTRAPIVVKTPRRQKTWTFFSEASYRQHQTGGPHGEANTQTAEQHILHHMP